MKTRQKKNNLFAQKMYRERNKAVAKSSMNSKSHFGGSGVPKRNILPVKTREVPGTARNKSKDYAPDKNCKISKLKTKKDKQCNVISEAHQNISDDEANDLNQEDSTSIKSISVNKKNKRRKLTPNNIENLDEEELDLVVDVPTKKSKKKITKVPPKDLRRSNRSGIKPLKFSRGERQTTVVDAPKKKITKVPFKDLPRSNRGGIKPLKFSRGKRQTTVVDVPKKKITKIPLKDLRKSNRSKIKPLEFWRGERQTIKRKNGIEVVKIEKGRPFDGGAVNAILSRNELINQKQKKVKENKTSLFPTTRVRNLQLDGEVEVNLHRPFDCVEWKADPNCTVNSKVPFYLTKTFISNNQAFGFLDIFPLQKKDLQYSPEDNVHFVVAKGYVKVTLRNNTFHFQQFDSFIVPFNEPYAIENLGSSKALLSFCTFKYPFFPYQIQED